MDDILLTDIEQERKETDERLSVFTAESDDYAAVLKSAEALHRIIRDDRLADMQVADMVAKDEAAKLAAERAHEEAMATLEVKKYETKSRVVTALITAGASIGISLIAIYASQTNVILRDALTIGQNTLRKIF